MPSTGSRGDAYDNAARESFMASIKTELSNRRRFKTKDEARTAIFSYIEVFYNPSMPATQGARPEEPRCL